jgi:hypothetical protein
MATHGEIQWPPAGTFDGRLWGASHGRRHIGLSGLRVACLELHRVTDVLST